MCQKSSNNIPADLELEPLLEALRRRYAELDDTACQRRVFLNRLRNLARFAAEPVDYQQPAEVALPKELEIAFAVCHPECGNQALIVVDGGPEGCDCCGGTMYPVEVASYRLKKS